VRAAKAGVGSAFHELSLLGGTVTQRLLGFRPVAQPA